MALFVIIVSALILVGLTLYFRKRNGADLRRPPPPPEPRPFEWPHADAVLSAADGDDDDADDRVRFHPYEMPPPEAPVALAPPADGPAPPGLAGLRAFERVSESGGSIDISPDGREALVLHDGDSATLFEVASGKALQTWRRICPPEWVEESEHVFVNCAARRIFLAITGEIDSDELSDYILLDLADGAVVRIGENEAGMNPMAVGSLSGDGRYLAGFAVASKSQPAFDLTRRREGDFGDIVLAFGNIWPETAITIDGARFAYDQGDSEVIVLELGSEPEDWDAIESWGWPYYGPRFGVVADEPPARLAFAPDGDRLLVVESDGGMIVADIPGEDQRSIRPLPDLVEGLDYVFFDVTWVAGRDLAILEQFKPDTRLLLIDLAEGAVLRDWPMDEHTLRRIHVAQTGAVALIGGADGVIRVMPLLEDAEAPRIG